jgi:hypothetical protein
MAKLLWTRHARAKMRYWSLSEARVKRVLHMPLRVEGGIAPHTVAMLQAAGSKKHPYEIWVMVNDRGKERRVISAWRYPARTKPGEPLPKEILRELREALL